jgi:hypothetical protein
MLKQKAMHNGWITMQCNSCSEYYYSFENINKVDMCDCGCKELTILEVEEWVGLNFLNVCKEALNINGKTEFISIIDNIYDKYKSRITSEEVFAGLLRDLSDELFAKIDE